ncbi:transcriptional regulator, ArsR family [Methanocaldococcus infernus ME]|uniref:Transcriptional regulator, ArsR family n=1 Tax=Methanocaldococcus infernus (strain DSM 11812 / JCM 15783 / ME) TaxID=573063 RepID=D5VQC2_METIM|nr:transcriptional regulator, ArsR family [Methanocaldococcus infernus ME]
MNSKKLIIEMFSEIARVHGLSKSVGAIYGLLFYYERPMSLDEIVEELKISKGNASMSLKKLEELGFVKRTWIEGERKNFYQISESFSSIKDIARRKHEIIKSYYEKLKEENLDEKKLEKIRKMLILSEKILKVLEELD